MNVKTNCVNCGAPVRLDRCSCPWCDSPYEIDKDDEYQEVTLYMDNQVLTRIVPVDRFSIDYNFRRTI